MTEAREVVWLRRVRDLSRELVGGTDPADLLQRVLGAAIELTGAERGLVVRVKTPGAKPSVRVEAARGFTEQELARSPSLSRRVIQRVLREGTRGLVTTSERDADLLDVTSVLGLGVVCVACVPMRLRGAPWGVLYLDHRGDRDAFVAGDLPALSAFADVASLAIESAELRAKAVAVPALPALTRFGDVVGGAPAMRALFEAIERCARSWDPVLISGEVGTGRGLVAAELHARGSFPQQPLVTASCSGPAADTHERLLGSRGALALAGRGSVVLRRLERLDDDVQDELLRVLEEGRLPPTRGGRELQARLLVLSDAEPRPRSAGGAIRDDLFYRLDVLRLRVPPLRERSDDVPLLVAEFAQRHAGRSLELTGEAQAALQRCPWPGNVRQLENEVKRLLATELPRIPLGLLSPDLRPGAPGPPLPAGDLRELQRDAVLAALETCAGNKAQAARTLGVSRSTLYRLIERYGIG